jgi:hypothetical protein
MRPGEQNIQFVNAVNYTCKGFLCAFHFASAIPHDNLQTHFSEIYFADLLWPELERTGVLTQSKRCWFLHKQAKY